MNTSEKRYVLKFIHTTTPVVSTVGIYSTLEEAKDGIGIGNGLGEWSHESQESWSYHSRELPFYYAIRYEVPPAIKWLRKPGFWRRIMNRLAGIGDIEAQS